MCFKIKSKEEESEKRWKYAKKYPDIRKIPSKLHKVPSD